MTALSADGRPARNWGRLLERLIPLLALVLLIAATAVWERAAFGRSDFLTVSNLLNVLWTQAPVGIVAVGMTFAILSGGIDLSVGSMVAMAGTAGLYVMEYRPAGGAAMVLAGFAVMVAVGLVAGLVNGLLVSVGRLPPFIATIGGLAAYRSVAKLIADNGTLNAAGGRNEFLSSLHLGGLPIPFTGQGHAQATLHYAAMLFLVVCLAAGLILNRTRYGRYTLAVGGNERAAMYSGIPVGLIKTATYVLVGLCCGLGAILLGVKQSSISSADTGTLYELDAIAAVVIGGTRMSGGSGSVSGTFLGVLILGVINKMLGFLNVPAALQGLVKGVIIVCAVLLQRTGKRR